MDVTQLHAATEDLAGSLSELSVGDLRHPTPEHPQGIGELIERLKEDNRRVAADLRRRLGAPEPADSDDRWAAPDATPDLLYGGGFEIGYRRTAASVEEAFAAAPDSDAELAELYRQRVTETRRHARDLAVALGLD